MNEITVGNTKIYIRTSFVVAEDTIDYSSSGAMNILNLLTPYGDYDHVNYRQEFEVDDIVLAKIDESCDMVNIGGKKLYIFSGELIVGRICPKEE